MKDFPEFMKKDMNKVPSAQQNTQDGTRTIHAFGGKRIKND